MHPLYIVPSKIHEVLLSNLDADVQFPEDGVHMLVIYIVTLSTLDISYPSSSSSLLINHGDRRRI